MLRINRGAVLFRRWMKRKGRGYFQNSQTAYDAVVEQHHVAGHPRSREPGCRYCRPFSRKDLRARPVGRSVGDTDCELSIAADRKPLLGCVLNAQNIETRQRAEGCFVEESVNRYVVALLRHTRGNRHLALGASPRSGIALLRLAKARALVERREYVVPEDICELAAPVLCHRLLLAPEARSAGLSPEDVVREALDGTPVPV